MFGYVNAMALPARSIYCDCGNFLQPDISSYFIIHRAGAHQSVPMLRKTIETIAYIGSDAPLATTHEAWTGLGMSIPC